MFKKGLLQLILTLLFFNTHILAQIDSIHQRIFLVGDAGGLINGGHPVVDWLKKNVNWDDTTNMVVYLGDNIYQYGLPMQGEIDYGESKQVIDYQVSIVKGKKARAYIIPGNHDWANGAPVGFQRITNQMNYVNGLGLPNVQAWPLNGCPGPVLVEISNKVILVIGDSQWFLHLEDKPGPGSGCAACTIDEFVTELDEIVATHPDQLLMFAMHHPFYTYGPHGGDYKWEDHIFPLTKLSPNLYIPLPILGSAYPIARGYFGNVQDIYHPLYRNMINEIEASLRKHPNPIHVAGHDHALQLNIKDSMAFIVSGSGSRLTGLRKGKYNVFSDVNLGFSMVEIRKSGKVTVSFYDVSAKDLSKANFQRELKTITPTTPAVAEDYQNFTLPDSVIVAANANLEAGRLKEILIGKNYRQEWTDSIKVQVLDIGKEMGGLKPVRQSGSGSQRVLTLQEKKGKQWILRTLDRFPQNIMPSDLRTPLNRYIKTEDVSASYPYASIVAGSLSSAATIPTVRRKIVYIPDDPRLTRFRSDFKNKIAILEEKEPVGIINTLTTEDMVLKIQKENKAVVDQRQVLKTRLMDNFVMDFNRFSTQYNWSSYDTGKGTKIYFPIPLNPSQAFFTNQGIVPWLSQKMLAIAEIRGFEDRVSNINSFNKTAHNFDHLFLNSLGKEDWEKEIDLFLQRMTDSVIDRAAFRYNLLNKPNTYRLTDVLKSRKKYFKHEMLHYYKFLSKEVTIVGSSRMEQYTVYQQPDGMVHVKVQEIGPRSTLAGDLYERTFDPKTTKEIRIYGLEGDDKFMIQGNKSPIHIRIIGGPGVDNYANESQDGDIELYDVDFERSILADSNNFISHISPDPNVNLYNRQQFKTDYVSPGLSIAYNKDDGALLGGTLEFFKHGFRKEPYDKRQSIRINYATATSSWHFKYEGDFIKRLGKNDLIVRADLKAPVNVTNFFGPGSSVKFNDETDDIQYYRTRYDLGRIFIGLRHRPQNWINADIGPAIQFYDIESNPKNHTLLDTISNTKEFYDTKVFAGVEGDLFVDTRNNTILPTRGAVLKMYGRQVFGLNSDYKALTQLGMDLAFFMSINPNTKTVLGVRVGSQHNFGKFEFPFANYLSGITNLRGYRKDRFAGRTIFYNNVELRLRMFQFRTYLFPGSVGLLAFHDVGKVWWDGDKSNGWHNGYGGGIWFSPVNRFVFTGTVAHSKEEKLLPQVTFGFQF